MCCGASCRHCLPIELTDDRTKSLENLCSSLTGEPLRTPDHEHAPASPNKDILRRGGHRLRHFIETCLPDPGAVRHISGFEHFLRSHQWRRETPESDGL